MSSILRVAIDIFSVLIYDRLVLEKCLVNSSNSIAGKLDTIRGTDSVTSAYPLPLISPSFARTGQIEIRWARIITPHFSSPLGYLIGVLNGDQRVSERT